LAQASAAGETRGEFVLVIAPPHQEQRPSAEDADALLRQALARASLKDAVGEVAAATGLPRRELYQRALTLSNETDPETRNAAPR
jgi:16S rRNA (cytidine1402-2'-O)-methyltransferase